MSKENFMRVLQNLSPCLDWGWHCSRRRILGATPVWICWWVRVRRKLAKMRVFWEVKRKERVSEWVSRRMEWNIICALTLILDVCEHCTWSMHEHLWKQAFQQQMRFLNKSGICLTKFKTQWMHSQVGERGWMSVIKSSSNIYVVTKLRNLTNLTKHSKSNLVIHKAHT